MARSLDKILHTPKESNFWWLLVGLLITLAVSPAAEAFGFDDPIFIVGLIFSVTMIVGVWTLVSSKAWFNVGMALVVFSIFSSVAESLLPKAWPVEVLSIISLWLFCVLSFAFTVGHVFSPGEVNSERIVGAVCAYLLMGLIWGMAYLFIDIFDPAAFNGIDDLKEGERAIRLTYFSFVTLTTLGYGDVAPAMPLTRLLAYMQAVAGQIYLTVVVAALVGMYISTRIIPEKYRSDDEG